MTTYTLPAGTDYYYVQTQNLTVDCNDDGDTVQVETPGNFGSVTINGGAGNDELIGGDGDLTSGVGGNDFLNGNGGNDTLIGGGGVDTLNGGDGNDVLNGNGGAGVFLNTAGPSDFLDGGTGTNTMVCDYSHFYFTMPGSNPPQPDPTKPDCVSVDISTGQGQVTVTGDGTSSVFLGEQFQNIQILNFSGNDGADNVTGGALNDTISTAGGDDVIVAGAGDDILSDEYDHINIDGGAGNDSLLLTPDSDITGDVVVDASTGSGQLTVGGQDYGTFTSIEHFDFEGGPGNDTITGETDTYSTYVSQLIGGAGDDTITAGDSATNLEGDDGNDILNGGAGNDTLTGGPGMDVIHGGAGDDTININIDNGGVDDLVAGETYDGGTGNDTIVLSTFGGSDVTTADFSSVTITSVENLDASGLFYAPCTITMTSTQFNAFQSIVGSTFSTAPLTVQLTDNSPVTVVTGDRFSALQLADGGQTATGDNFLNILGGDGDDTIHMAFGASGGAGNDTIDGRGTLNGDAGDDTLTADSAATLNGGSGNDTLNGSTGNDILDGGPGADKLNGGAGVNTLSYADDTTGVTVNLLTQTASGGDATGDVITFSSFEDLAGGTGNDVLTGDNNNNVITGGGGNDVLTGNGGNDTLIGGAGNDTFDGGAGNDTMESGGGVDTFIYNGQGADTVIGFSSADVINITSTYTSLSQVLAHTTVSGNNTIISFSTGNSLTLNNYTTTLTSANVTFGSGGGGAAPTVTNLAHTQTNNATDLKAGEVVTVTLTMSEQNLKVSGTPGLLLTNGYVAAYNAKLSSPANGTLVFTYTVAAGQNTADLQVTGTTSGTWSVTDQSNNAADFSGAVEDLGLAVDTHTPAITGVTAHVTSGPAANAGFVVSGDTVEIDIALSDDPLLVTGTPVLKLGSLTTTYASTSTDLTNGILAFDYLVAANQKLTVLKIASLTVPKGGAITDGAGNAANIKLSNTEKALGITADGVPPAVKSVKAKSSSKTIVNGSTVAITLTMSEAVTVTGTPSLQLSDGKTANYTSGSGGKTLVFTYDVGSEQTTDLQIASINQSTGNSIADLAGNALSSTYTRDLKLKINPPPKGVHGSVSDISSVNIPLLTNYLASIAPAAGSHGGIGFLGAEQAANHLTSLAPPHG